MSKSFTGNFYDEDYFERGKESGKGWLENYRWLPRRSFKEALAYIDYLDLDESSYVLDFGTAKGFIVKALRELDIRADGCDISDYALRFAPNGCWNCSKEDEWKKHISSGYTHILAKDVLEHLTLKELEENLAKMSILAPLLMCIIPMGDNGVHRISEYHIEISHLLIQNETWWIRTFKSFGWHIVKDCAHVPGLKDNWMTTPDGNHVFVLKFI
jgi:hypothetical protein